MIDFASYAFNKAHAACYAVVGYQTAWLKTYYPVEFMAATLNSFMDSTDRISSYIAECKLMGISVLPPDVNESAARFTVVGGKIRYAMTALKNVGLGPAENIVAERKANGPFRSFGDFCERLAGSDVNKRAVESFIKSGAFDTFGVYRSRLLAVYEQMLDAAASVKKNSVEGQLSLFDMAGMSDMTPHIEENYPDIKEYDNDTLLKFEKDTIGLYLSCLLYTSRCV